MALLHKMKEKEKEECDSLWKDEDKPGERESAMDIADSTEVAFDAPELVDAADVMPSAEGWLKTAPYIDGYNIQI